MNKIIELEFPEIINVEIMTVCNLKCRHCRLQYRDSSLKSQKMFMTLDDFEKYSYILKEMIEHANEFMFSSIEPLLHPQLFDMINIVKNENPDMSFPIQTNGMIMSDKIEEELPRKNVPWISVALDGIDQSTSEFFKTGTEFDTVVNNIKIFNRIMPANCEMRTVFVAHQGNISILPDYIEMCYELGVNAIDVNGLLCFDRKYQIDTLYGKSNIEDTETIFKKAQKKAEVLGIEINFPFLRPTYVGCEWMRVFSVDIEGNVCPCVMLSEKIPFFFEDRETQGEKIIFGNILSQSPKDIWDENKYVNFRHKIINNCIPKQCKSCAEAYGVICSHR